MIMKLRHDTLYHTLWEVALVQYPVGEEFWVVCWFPAILRNLGNSWFLVIIPIKRTSNDWRFIVFTLFLYWLNDYLPPFSDMKLADDTAVMSWNYCAFDHRFMRFSSELMTCFIWVFFYKLSILWRHIISFIRAECKLKSFLRL